MRLASIVLNNYDTKARTVYQTFCSPGSPCTMEISMCIASGNR